MLDVLLTCDTEIWCDGWNDLDAKFPSAFARYVYGRTPRGSYGLPFQVMMLREHGLRGVFFVEPLFAARFGIAPLREIVDIVKSGEQEVQMHLHTEWADEARPSLLPGLNGKRQHLRHFSAGQQAELIRAGVGLLEAAGGGRPRAFRAGSFGFNRDTLRVLPSCGFSIDSSYNHTLLGPSSDVSPGTPLLDVTVADGVVEFPMSVFEDGFGKLRHTQIGACAAVELEQALWNALERGQRALVVLFHNFELLDRSKTRPDSIVVKRFERMCRFLSDHRDSFRVVGFHDVEPKPAARQPAPLRVSTLATARRIVEQAVRRVRY